MNLPAAAFLCVLLLAPSAARAQSETEEKKPEPPATEAAPAESQAPGGAPDPAYASSFNGERMSSESLQGNPEALWALSQGKNPIIGPGGKIMGFNDVVRGPDGKPQLGADGKPIPICTPAGEDFLKQYAAAAEAARVPSGPCQPMFPSCNQPADKGQLPPAADDPFSVADMMATLGAGANGGALPPANPGDDFCKANPGRPPCAPVKEEDPKEVAKNDLETSEKEADEALNSGDDTSGIAALTKRNDAEDRLGQTDTDVASTDPAPAAMSGGQGQGIGAQGQVGGDPFANAKKVRATPEQEWAAKKAEKEGMLNPLLTPSGPAISVAERMRQGFGGTFAALVGYKDELFGKAAGVQANPEADLSAGEATSTVMDGARTDAPVIHVAGCRNRRDTLDGNAGGRVLKSPNGC